MREKEVFKTGIEIFLLVCSIFAFAYIIKDYKDGEVVIEIKKPGVIFSVLKAIIFFVLNEKSLVSALAPSDLENGVATCLKSKDGSLCQEYPASECNAKCGSECIPTKRDDAPGCKVGTCYDSETGTCQERALEGKCTELEGKWFNDIAGNVAECQKACCIFGDQTKPLVTKKECEYLEKTTGMKTTYRNDLKTELECWALARVSVEGACIFETEDTRSCRFITKENCNSLKGQFFEGYLCTHPDFRLKYQKQATAKCVEDKLYWFDSEGNKENIYDASRAKSWNNGKVLSEQESCQLGTTGGKITNQESCGNCNYLLGSVCSDKTASEKVADGSIGFVCKDSRCKDSKGNIRQKGESWCEYQGNIGIDKGSGGFNRSTDTPGSRHFIANCNDGKVEVNPCDEYRNSICSENKAERTDGIKISSAACIKNLWQLCVDYNTEETIEKRDEKCSKNPLCELKQVYIDKSFKFSVCTPKYPGGFDLQENPDGGELSCQFGSQKCTVIYIKRIEGWYVAVNENCLSSGFTEQMNDLCMSLGDCGAKVNYNGDFTKNYKIVNTQDASSEYFAGIKKDSEPKDGKYVSFDSEDYAQVVGGADRLAGEYEDTTPEGLKMGGMVAGGAGVLMAIYPGAVATISGGTLATPAVAAPSWAPFVKFVTFGLYDAAAVPAALSALGGALAGAAIGFAVVSLLIEFTGIGRGLDPAVTWSLIGSGAVAGMLIGYTVAGEAATGSMISALSSSFAFLSVPFVGWVIMAVVITIIIVLTAMGVGDKKEVVVEFECKPWQPILGGSNCDKCGKDGYPCSKYSCQALGQTCRLLNEEETPDKRLCVDIGRGDVSGPIISPWKEALGAKYSYEEEGINGVKIVSSENEGCLNSYETILFGITLNEPGLCVYNLEHSANFDEMNNEKGGLFGGSNIFKQNHTNLFMMPDLTTLGVPGYDPTARADFNLYVRCIDGNGNGKTSAEYVMNLCVMPGKDVTAPIIMARSPFKEYVKYDATEMVGEIFTNEPADCKWSLDSTKKYDEMENNMVCSNGIYEMKNIFGWSCNATFPIDKEETTIGIKCKDQPWYGENWQGSGRGGIDSNVSKRNEMGEAYPFVIKRTKTSLNISYVYPNNETFLFGVQPATVVLEVHTVGGVDDRATCTLFGAEMSETFGKIHKSEFNQIFAGNYSFPIVCEDSAGNVAQATSKFKVEIDVSAPVITRLYEHSGVLVVITNEQSSCAYVRKDRGGNCDFDFKNGTLMEGEGETHTTNLEDGEYLIKCADIYGSVSGECMATKRGGF